MLNYLKRRFSSTELINEIRGSYGSSQQPSHQQPAQEQQRPTLEEYKYLPEEMRTTTTTATVEDIYTQRMADVGTAGQTRMPFPSAPSSPTRQTGGGGAGGFFSSMTGQLTKAKHIFSTEALNSIIGDAKLYAGVDGVGGGGAGPRCKILLVIDHSLTDWSKYLHRRKLEGGWEVRVEQAQFNDISIEAHPDQGCVVTVQDSRGGRPPRSFKPDFVLIRQGLGATTQNYENLITGIMFGGVPCMNSVDAIYNMRNKAWLFCHLLELQRRLGPAEFPLITRSFQTKSQPQTPDFQMPVMIRLGGDTARECEVQVKDAALFQSMMALANNTQRYATTEPCIQSVCEIFIQKIGPFVKAFMFHRWISELSQMFGGLDMCAIKAIQDTTGDYHIQDVFGSDFMFLGDGQEEDRSRIAELLLQKLEQSIKRPAAVPTTISLHQIAPHQPTPPQQTPRTQPPQLVTSPGQTPTFTPSGGGPAVLTTTTDEQSPRQPQKTRPPTQQSQPPYIQSDKAQPSTRQDVLTKMSAGSMDVSSPLRPQAQTKMSTGKMDFSYQGETVQTTTDVKPRISPGLAGTNQVPQAQTQNMQREPEIATDSMDFESDWGKPEQQRQPRSFSTSTGTKPMTELQFQRTQPTMQKQPQVISMFESPPGPRPPGGDFGSDASRGRPSRESSIDSATGLPRSRPYKEAAPQPPRQPSITNSVNSRKPLDQTSTVSPPSSMSIFDPSMNVFAPTTTSNASSVSTFKSDPSSAQMPPSAVERIASTFGTMSFESSATDFGSLRSKPPQNDPWAANPISEPTPPIQKYQPQTQHQTTPRSSGPQTDEVPRRQTSQFSSGRGGGSSSGPPPEDADDTMKNLRKTFAGIFGDI